MAHHLLQAFISNLHLPTPPPHYAPQLSQRQKPTHSTSFTAELNAPSNYGSMTSRKMRNPNSRLSFEDNSTQSYTIEASQASANINKVGRPVKTQNRNESNSYREDLTKRIGQLKERSTQLQEKRTKNKDVPRTIMQEGSVQQRVSQPIVYYSSNRGSLEAIRGKKQKAPVTFKIILPRTDRQEEQKQCSKPGGGLKLMEIKEKYKQADDNLNQFLRVHLEEQEHKYTRKRLLSPVLETDNPEQVQ